MVAIVCSDFPATLAPNTAKIGDNKRKILKERNQDGFVVYITTKRHYRIRKLMQVYCDEVGLCRDSVYFRFAGQRIYMVDTMASTGMEDGATIEVYKQAGGPVQFVDFGWRWDFGT
uniref:Rad60/SUMO-like domain-containing protein n=1 Tax=Anopheles atroparvus TaxID=41427 RepID=A0AAG5DNX8_ANOAO